ncbi:hypothetical protein D4N35_010855 [Siminovitchia fortis]|uniref:Uncharacterized protein n=1 Tax=Siminovitchia fortis TaxID=254758 RepID=A0A443IRE2_9BACI|nr:hypothetical protein D4N35_010855 [Siminovitchia fortis]
MAIFVEVLRVMASVLLIFSSAFYLRDLDRTRKQRKLSASELTMYIVIQIAFGFFTISLLISVFIL